VSNSQDPTLHSRWRPLRLLQDAMDADIARVYADAQVSGVKPSWVLELLRLHARGPMTITELAESVQRTHSALSQKVAAMRAAGLVRTTTGADGRTRTVTLTAKARALAERHARSRGSSRPSGAPPKPRWPSSRPRSRTR
jgi:DNA-binding MarR family transcriptional regulator